MSSSFSEMSFLSWRSNEGLELFEAVAHSETGVCATETDEKAEVAVEVGE